MASMLSCWVCILPLNLPVDRPESKPLDRAELLRTIFFPDRGIHQASSM